MANYMQALLRAIGLSITPRRRQPHVDTSNADNSISLILHILRLLPWRVERPSSRADYYTIVGALDAVRVQHALPRLLSSSLFRYNVANTIFPIRQSVDKVVLAMPISTHFRYIYQLLRLMLMTKSANDNKLATPSYQYDAMLTLYFYRSFFDFAAVRAYAPKIAIFHNIITITYACRLFSFDRFL